MIPEVGIGGAMDVAFLGGRFASVVEGLDRPTSLELIGDSAFVVTLTGKVIRIDGVGCAHRGVGHGA
jgi:hypothetical protein